MKRPSAAGLARLLLIAALAGPPATAAHAASWQWSGLPDRERITITLDRPGDVDVARTGRQSLSLTSRAVGAAPARMGGADPARAALVGEIAPQPGGLRIDTRTPGFGYVVTRPAPDRVVVDIFRDPMGERWAPADAAQPGAQPAPQQTDAQRPETPPASAQPTPQQAAATPPAVQQPGPASTPAKNGARPPRVLERALTDATGPQADAPLPAVPDVPAPQQATAAPQAAGQPPVQTPAQDAPSGSVTGKLSSGPATAPPAQVTGQIGGQNGGQTGASAPAQPPAAATQAPGQVAPQAAAQQPEQQRSFFAVPYAVRARINAGGPGDWPEEAAASATTTPPAPVPSRGEAGPAATTQPAQPPAQPAQPAQPAAPQAVAQAPAQPAPAQTGQPPQGSDQGEARKSAAPRPEGPTPPAQPDGQPAKPPTGDATSPQAKQAEDMGKNGGHSANATNATNATQVVYVDEKGNPVPPPPVPAELLEQAKTAMVNGEYPKALELLETLKGLHDTPRDMREEVLYLIGDVLYAQGKDNPLSVYDKVVAVTSEAMNYNLKSHRVPQALLRLGLVNMRIGNSQEAEGYFNLLRRQYPHDENVPLALYYAGEEAYKRGNYQRAADKFQSIVQEFPESKYVREGSVSLARTLHKMGYYPQAESILDFVDKRWGRFYLEYPQLLTIAGDVAYQVGKLDDARANYWLYYNLIPDGEETDTALARIGDVLAKQKQTEAAREIYEEAVRRFPDRDGGLISLMRLAEEGIHDAPNIAEMVSVFQRPDNTRPVQAYTTIIAGHPQSALVPLARLKLAMWYLWNRQFPEAMATSAEFVQAHPGHELLPKVRDVALQSFTQTAAESVGDGNYGRILQMWEQYPLLQENEKALSADTRVALGLSYSREGQPQRALDILDGFLKGPKDARHGETALSLALSVYLENQSWQHIVDLTQSVAGWTLSPQVQRQTDYALALAHENQEHPDLAVPLWQKLREQKDVPPEQRAYVNFFLSRDAERKRELQNAYLLTRESLTDFLAVAQANPDKADAARIKDCLISLMDITEAAGRLRESLDWAEQYAKYVPDSDPGYPAMRFRTARLQRKMGNMDAWKSTLEDLARRDPQSLYGRMAASELRTTDVTKGLSGFTPGAAP
ncbi:tetratricopeptide repeat protein [Nitratidesulfovibrio sp. HK-II]|uniref:tetratricopeptide repeat protein n=1 Tax=Nitratidesulfovibrio sp. HK-II TaxID=2009266 RepID=UPI000E2E6CC7|nr:tetratricopeptide repeat protein [Nitratidesulfovibrio sp. HK-II]GBO95066.1 TPR domain protein [Nitratidesulfovibrio sp. HK-II]